MIKLCKGDSQVVKYCKGHFARVESGNEVEDLRKIIAKRNGVDSHHVRNSDMIVVLCDIMATCGMQREFPNLLMKSFGALYGSNDPDPFRRTVQNIMACFCTLKVYDHAETLIDLQPADLSWLSS